MQGTAPMLSACLALAGCHQLAPAKPLSQLTPLESQGYSDFNAHCALCHYERTGDAKNGPSLHGVFQKPYLPSGAPANDDRVASTMLHGHGLMPPQNLDADQVSAILAYLHTV